MSEVAVITCPMPPSVNAIWRSRTGANGKPTFYLDPRYATWKRVFDTAILAIRPRPRIAGRFTITITLDDQRRRGDADNRAKAVLDALQRCAVIDDDKLADSVTVRWGSVAEGCLIVIYPSTPAISEAA